MRKLPRDFYNRDTVLVAQELLGQRLVRVDRGVRRIGRIVEVEAYLGPHDRAAHSARGLTPRTQTMFGPPGHAYVYLIYGMHYCLNVVTEPVGQAAAVLIRAVEPIANLDGKTSGPGCVCRALHIDKRWNGHDLGSDDLFIAPAGSNKALAIVRRRRVGVDYAGPWARRLLRFYIRDNPFVSRP